MYEFFFCFVLLIFAVIHSTHTSALLLFFNTWGSCSVRCHCYCFHWTWSIQTEKKQNKCFERKKILWSQYYCPELLILHFNWDLSLRHTPLFLSPFRPLTWICRPAVRGGTLLWPGFDITVGNMESSMKGLWVSCSTGLKFPEILSSSEIQRQNQFELCTREATYDYTSEVQKYTN